MFSSPTRQQDLDHHLDGLVVRIVDIHLRLVGPPLEDLLGSRVNEGRTVGSPSFESGSEDSRTGDGDEKSEGGVAGHGSVLDRAEIRWTEDQCQTKGREGKGR